MLSPSAQKVQDALDAFGIRLQVVELPGSTRSAADAAQAIGCSVGQIAKSLIFRGLHTGRPVLVIASGANPAASTCVSGGLEELPSNHDLEKIRV